MSQINSREPSLGPSLPSSHPPSPPSRYSADLPEPAKPSLSAASSALQSPLIGSPAHSPPQSPPNDSASVSKADDAREPQLMEKPRPVQNSKLVSELASTPTNFRVLYISEIDQFVTDEQLWQTFATWSHAIRSICLIKDDVRPNGMSHAFINFLNSHDAYEAFRRVQPLFLNSSYCRVSPYDGEKYRKPLKIDQMSGMGVFVKNLDPQLTAKDLFDHFLPFGEIQACKISTDFYGSSRGLGYVTFASVDQATNAIKAMNGELINERRVVVTRNVPRSQRGARIFVKVGGRRTPETPNETVTEEMIREAFKAYPSLGSISVPRDANGFTRGFAFATFGSKEEAEHAIVEVKFVAGLPATVDFAVNNFSTPLISEESTVFSPSSPPNYAQFPMANQYSTTNQVPATNQSRPPAQAMNNKTNVFVRPLPPSVTEQMLKTHFGRFGEIYSVKILTDSEGKSRGFGFVSYETEAAASAAVAELNGTRWMGDTLFVAPALVRRQSRVILSHNQASSGMYQNRFPAVFAPASAPVPMPGYYYVPMGYDYDSRYDGFSNPYEPTPVPGMMGSQNANSTTNAAPAVQLDPALQSVGESLYPIIIQNPRVNGDENLGNTITGMILQQPVNEIYLWMQDASVLGNVIDQALNAYQSWSQVGENQRSSK